MPLNGRTALVTGAGQGIGRACAEVLGARGASLILVDKNPKTLKETVGNLLSAGREAIPLKVDLTDLDALRAILVPVAERQKIDILVNNAGFDRPGTSAKVTPEDFEAVLRIHLTVPFVLAQCLLPGMRVRGWGRVVHVGSIYGLMGAKGELAYSTAKAGVMGLVKSLAKECGKDGVTVNAVLPGLTRTPTIENFMAQSYKDAIIEDTPLNRMAEASEIAKVIAFLASDEASFVTGAALPVSGGWGM